MPTELSKFLDPKTLTKIGGLDLKARLIVEGYISGHHKSPYHGFSVEFAEHREYTPATTSSTSTGRSSARPTACTSSSTRKRPTCARTFCSTRASP